MCPMRGQPSDEMLDCHKKDRDLIFSRLYMWKIYPLKKQWNNQCGYLVVYVLGQANALKTSLLKNNNK